MPKITLEEIAHAVGAVLEGGAPGLTVDHAAGLAEAGPGALSFLSNPKYVSQLAITKATAVIVGRNAPNAPCAILRSDNPDLAFAKAVTMISPPPPPPPPGIHPTAVIHPEAVIGSNVSIGPGTVIEAGVRIGDRSVLFAQVYIGQGSVIGSDCLLYPQVVVYHGVRIGDRCIFHSGSVIGSDGFGYAWGGRGYVKIPQVGCVVVENDVEVGANACIDRARFGETRIGAGTKLDNLVQIAHNVKLGNCCAFAAQVGIAGSAIIGSGVQMGGQSAAVGHITVGDGVVILGQSAVTKDIPSAEKPAAGISSPASAAGQKAAIWVDSPAKPIKEQITEWKDIKALGSLRKKVRDLEKRLSELEHKD